MQRWLVGAGVVVLALVGAVLFIPRTDTGAKVAEHVRAPVPVEKLHKASPVQLQKARKELDERREKLRSDANVDQMRPMSGTTVTASQRYRKQLAQRGLERSQLWKPWEGLDKALDNTGSKESIVFRRELVSLEKMTHAAFEDPTRFQELVDYQRKLITVMRKSPVSNDHDVQTALNAAEERTKVLARDISKL